MDSIWKQRTVIPAFPALTKDEHTDVLVIGGGLTGLLCGFLLTQEGLSCIVAEADTILSGVSGNTTAKITSQHGLIYSKLTDRYGMDTAKQYYIANQMALAEYRKLAATMPCDFTQEPAYIYSQGSADPLKAECDLVHSFGGSAELQKELPLPFPVTAALCFPEQAQFHPVKFAAAIAGQLRIFEHTPIRSLNGNVAETPQGHIRARHVIVATHFPFLRFRGEYFLKQYQERSYVICLSHAAPLSGMYLDMEKGGLSFRSHGDLLLLGGGGHRTGKKGSWEFVRAAAKKYYPEAREVSHWAAQDCMTLDGMPYIGSYGQGQYVATGFNKWGMTSAMVSAMTLRDQILKRDCPWGNLFSPSRSMLHPQLALNALEATKNLLTPTAPRCPHMGCALKWNPAEQSWDCPCHGSRFDRQGKLFSGPADHGLGSQGRKQ